ncbi:unnamed protein product [Allacma fusca]|uniref:PLAT domain-containing protein n=1 Tax=Allacma fusca TaxID=39272 RepID=A0A8J2J7B1_9HEXA|nr:unnamed protein product [Allacma fusca]
MGQGQGLGDVRQEHSHRHKAKNGGFPDTWFTRRSIYSLNGSESQRSSGRQAIVTENIARETLALTSEIIAQTRTSILYEIHRKAIRRTDERYTPDYYLDQADRDYFNDYHENWLGLQQDYDYSPLLQRMDLSLILANTDIEKKGINSYFAFAGVNELLIQMGIGKHRNYTFSYRDSCQTSNPGCIPHLSAYLFTEYGKAFKNKRLVIPGFNFGDTIVILPATLGNQSGLLQVQVVTTELNPFMFDPSIKRLAGPIFQIIVLDKKTQLRVSTDQNVQLQIPYDFLYYNDDDLNPRKDAQFFTVVVKPIENLRYWEYPVFKMTLLPKTIFTKETRPTPRLLCTANITDAPTKIPDIPEDVYEYPEIFNTLRIDEGKKDLFKMVDYYLTIFPQMDLNYSSGSFVNLSVEAFRATCVFRDEDKRVWSEKGCRANYVTHDFVNCTCPHLSTFSTAIMTTPSFLDIVDEIELNIMLEYNYLILAIVSSLLLVLAILLMACHLYSSRDAKNSGLHILADLSIRMEQHFYLITVYTGGLWRRRDTTGNISLQIYGSTGTSLPFVLREDTQKMKTLINNHVDSFLVSSFKGLGRLEKIRVWRDDHGNKPDWTCRKVKIQCLRSGKTYQFLVNKKFTLKFYGCWTVHEVAAAAEDDVFVWKQLFSDFLYEGFQDRHSFLSTLKCSPNIYFSRCQRLMCAATTVALYLVPIYWNREVFYRLDVIEPANFHLELKQLLIALCIFLLSTPIEVALRFLFRCTKPKRIITLLVWQSMNMLTNKNEQVFGYLDQFQNHHSELQPIYFNQQGGKLEEVADFSIPGINARDSERWIEGASNPRRFSYNEATPTDWIRSEESPSELYPNTGSDRRSSTLRSLERGSKIYRIRESLSTSFTFPNDEDYHVEDLIEKEIKKDFIKEKNLEKSVHFNSAASNKTTPNEFPAVKVVEVASLQNIRQIVQVFLCLHQPVKNRHLPHCCGVLAWILSSLLLLGSLTMAAFYGLRCGPILRWEIISDFVITFFLSILIFQPLYLFLLAGIKASFFRVRSYVDDWRFQVLLQKSAPDTSMYDPYTYSHFLPERAHPPLDERDSFKTKLRAVRISHSRRNVIMLMVHAFLMFMLILITYTNFSSHDYLQIRSLKGLLCVDDCWREVQDTEEFYNYLNEVLYKIHPIYYYDGTPIPYFADVPVYLTDETSMLVGVPRLHQFRIDSESTCASPTKFPCLSELFIQFETRDFDPKWLPFGSTHSAFMDNDVWKHQDSHFSKVSIGSIFYYPSSGYMAHLGRDFLSSYTVLNYLKKLNWIDGRTRGVFLELATYNPNVNLFVYTKLLAEISGSGVWFTSSVHYPITLTDVNTYAQESHSLYLRILFLLTGVAVLGKVAIQIREWVIYRKVTTSEIILVLLTISSLVIGLYRLHLVANLKKALDNMLVNDHIIFDKVCFWDQWQQDMFALTFSFAVLMILQYIFKTKREFFILDACLKLSSKYLLGHGFLICLMLLTFAMLGYVVFSSSSFWFHSFPSCLITLLQEIVGNYFIYELTEEERWWGQIFEVLFTVAVVIVGINLMISILDNGFTEARRIAQEKKFWMSYFYFIRKYFPSKPRFRGYPVVHPQRLLSMQCTSATFLRECFQTQELQQKQRMFHVTEDYLKPRGYSLVSNSLKKKRMRANVRVEKRMEVMRFLINYLLQIKMNSVLTHDQVQVHSEFAKTLLKLKLRKLEEKIETLEEAIGKLRFRERSSSIVL